MRPQHPVDEVADRHYPVGQERIARHDARNGHTARRGKRTTGIPSALVIGIDRDRLAVRDHGYPTLPVIADALHCTGRIRSFDNAPETVNRPANGKCISANRNAFVGDYAAGAQIAHRGNAVRDGFHPAEFVTPNHQIEFAVRRRQAGKPTLSVIETLPPASRRENRSERHPIGGICVDDIRTVRICLPKGFPGDWIMSPSRHVEYCTISCGGRCGPSALCVVRAAHRIRRPFLRNDVVVHIVCIRHHGAKCIRD